MTKTQNHPTGVTAASPTLTSPAPADPRPVRRRLSVRSRRLLLAMSLGAVVAIAAVWTTTSTESEPTSPPTLSATLPDLDDPVVRQEFVDRFEAGSFGLHDATG